MSSHVTEYRADFYLLNQDLSFRVDNEPRKDPDAEIAPLLIHGAHIQDNGTEYMRWCRSDLEVYIGGHIKSPRDVQTGCASIYTLSIEGDALLDASTAAIRRVEAFAVNNRGGVKQGIFMSIEGPSVHSVLQLPSSNNYVLESLSFCTSSRVSLFDSQAKHRGKRVRLQQ